VIKGRTGTVVATLRVGSEAWGVAVDPRARLVYVTDPTGNKVSVVSERTRKLIARVKVGRSPFIGVATDPTHATAYVANDFGDSVSVLNSCRDRKPSPQRCRRN
jgi:YVTN family beta-propeller protein